MRASIGFVPEDRRSQNIVPDFSIEENLLLAHLGAHRGFGRGYTPGGPPRRSCSTRWTCRRIACGIPACWRSGGMQQKILIARWLLIEPGC